MAANQPTFTAHSYKEETRILSGGHTGKTWRCADGTYGLSVRTKDGVFIGSLWSLRGEHKDVVELGDHIARLADGSINQPQGI